MVYVRAAGCWYCLWDVHGRSRAWIDTDKDGIQDPGEVGLGGTIFLLRTSSSALVAVANSDSSGAYLFSNIPTGNYYVEVIPPANYTLTVKDAGGNDALDNDFDTDTASSDVFTFSGLGAKYDLDAGFYLAFGG